MRCYHCMKEYKTETQFCPFCGRPPSAPKTIPVHKTRIYNKQKKTKPEIPEPKAENSQVRPEPLQPREQTNIVSFQDNKGHDTGTEIPAQPREQQYKVSWHDEGAEELIDEVEEYRIKKENKRFFIIEGILGALAVVLAAAIIYIAFFQKDPYTYYTMEGNSMLDTIADGDKVASVKLEGTPKTGDIVVFSFGKGVSIKRVIATGGQTLWLDYENDRIVVDDNELKEDYIKGSTFSEVRENYLVPYNIPDGKVFVLGDNRKNSVDSRYKEVGLLDEKDIIAKVDHIDKQ